MTFLCSTLLAFNLLKEKVPVGARCIYELKDPLEKRNVVAIMQYWNTGFKVIKVYDDFMRLERIE